MGHTHDKGMGVISLDLFVHYLENIDAQNDEYNKTKITKKKV
jgi:hypothetical protein